jgi:hypothetical protein
MNNGLTDSYNGKFTGYTVNLEPIGAEIEPVSLEEAKLYARIDGSSEDALITALIKAARVNLEKQMSKCILPKTVTINSFSYSYSFQLPYAPLLLESDVTKVATFDILNNEMPLNYIVNTGLFPKINIINGSQGYKFQMVYKAGFAVVPEDIKLAIKMLVNTMYERREDFSDLAAIQSPFGVRAIIEPYVTYNWFGA